MKICPYCGTEFPENEILCPHCGELFWEPGLPDEAKKKEAPSEEEDGCFSLFLVPLLTAVLVVAFIVLAVYLLNLVTHFDEKQEAIIWIGLSFFLSYLVYQVRQKIKNKNKKNSS
jgi:hypothetical protein